MKSTAVFSNWAVLAGWWKSYPGADCDGIWDIWVRSPPPCHQGAKRSPCSFCSPTGRVLFFLPVPSFSPPSPQWFLLFKESYRMVLGRPEGSFCITFISSNWAFPNTRWGKQITGTAAALQGGNGTG